MGRRRAIQPFEPVLIEKRGERRLAQFRLPHYAQERGRRLVGLLVFAIGARYLWAGLS